MTPANSSFYPLCKRTVDLLIVMPALILAAPILAFAWIHQIARPSFLVSVILTGKGCRPFRGLTSRLDAVRVSLRFWDVFCGRASVVGPRILPMGELNGQAADIRTQVAPGLVCLHWLRWRSNVAFYSEDVSDLEYATQACLRTDLSILLRAVLVLLYGRSGSGAERSIDVLGVHINNLTMHEALRLIDSNLRGEKNSTQIAFVNADCLNRATADAAYRRALESASLVLADGIGIKIAGTLLSRPIRQNVNGTDLFPRLCERLNVRSGRLFLLGARKNVALALADLVRNRYPNITVCGAHDGYFTDEAAMVRQIAEAAPDVLLVALGAPLQEMFIARNKHRLGAKVCIGVGGLFDFYSGRIPRAPQWLRETGLEWAYRLYQEPRRMWRRYLLGNVTFLVRVFAERCGVSYNYPKTAVTR